jgi:hypothetical protein
VRVRRRRLRCRHLHDVGRTGPGRSRSAALDDRSGAYTTRRRPLARCRGNRSLRDRRDRRAGDVTELRRRLLSSGPGRSRTCDLGIKRTRLPPRPCFVESGSSTASGAAADALSHGSQGQVRRAAGGKSTLQPRLWAASERLSRTRVLRSSGGRPISLGPQALSGSRPRLNRLRLGASPARTPRPCGESLLELSFQTPGRDVMFSLTLDGDLDPDSLGLKADDLHVVGHVLPV